MRDRPDRRRAYGINAPLHVSVAGGERVRAAEWSHLGVVLPDEAVPPLDGGLVQVVLHVDYQGFQIDVPARARLDETGEDPPGAGLTRLEFVDLTTRGREVVQRFVDDYVRGRAVATGDALVTLDAPHEPIDIKPDPKPETLGQRIRPFAMSALYLAVGLVTFAYLGVLLYAHLVRLEVRTAVVTRPIEVVRTNDDGTIRTVHRSEGETVPPGGLIARLADPALEEDIARAKASAAKAESAVKITRKRLRIDEQRLRDYQLLWAAERRGIERDVASAEREWRRALARFHRSVPLWDENAQGSTSKWDVLLQPNGWAWTGDESGGGELGGGWGGGEWGRACLARLKPREVAHVASIRATFPRPQTIADIRRAEIVPCAVLVQRYREVVRREKAWRALREDAKQQRRIDKLSDTRLFNGNAFVVDLDVAMLARDEAKAQAEEAKAAVMALEAQRGRADLRSAQGGRLVEIAVASRLPVTKGQTVAVIEAPVAPTVDAYLTQEEIAQIGLGDRAEVFVPALEGAGSSSFAARVVRVDRTAGHRNDVLGRHVWREDGARSGLVRLALEGEGAARVSSGLPATVLFARRSPGLLRRRATGDVAARLFPEHVGGGPRLDRPSAYDDWRGDLARMVDGPPYRTGPHP